MKHFGKIAFIFVLMLWQTAAYAQDDKAIRAFAESYKAEYAGNIKQAIAEIQKAYNESSYEMNMRLGWLHYSLGLFAESVNYYQKAMNNKTASIEAKLGYALPAGALGNWDKVVSEYNNILKIDPQNTTANYRLGLFSYNKKDYANAYKYFEKVVNLHPMDYNSLLMFAWTNLQMGKGMEAKILFNKVLLISPSDKSALEGLTLVK
jgi:tetratricopeptide (TPR) repeat protein